MSERSDVVHPIISDEVNDFDKDRRGSTQHAGIFDNRNTAFAKGTQDHIHHHSMVGSFMAVVAEVIEKIRHRRTREYQSFVVTPGDRFRKKWDIITILMLLYSAWFTPIQIAFFGDTMTFLNIEDWIGIFICDRVVEVVFFFDIFVNFRTAWTDSSGEICFCPYEAARRYLRTWFVIDVISILPFDALVLLSSVGQMPALRIPRLLRLFRLAKVARIIGQSSLVKRFEETTSMKYGWIRLIKFAILIIVIAHWMACGVFFASVLGEDRASGWVYRHNLHDAPLGTQYSACIYWAVMTLTTVGYGDITAYTETERWVFSMFMLFSAGVYAYIVGTMCSLVQGLDATNLVFQSHMDEVNEYMNKCKLPFAVQYRIRKFLHYKKHASIRSINPMNGLSPAIRNEVALYNYERVLASVTQFRGAPAGFLAALAIALRPVVYGPNELIITLNRTSHSMYILNKGRVQWERIGPDGKILVVRILRSGGYFGERALLKAHARSECSIRTLTFVETCELRKCDVDPIMREYPEVKRIVRLSVMKEILFRNMRNGLLRSIADQPAFLRVQKQAWLELHPLQSQMYHPGMLYRSDSVRTEASIRSNEAFEESITTMQQDLQKQNKAISKLTKLVIEQQKLLNELLNNKRTVVEDM